VKAERLRRPLSLDHEHLFGLLVGAAQQSALVQPLGPFAHDRPELALVTVDDLGPQPARLKGCERGLFTA
jgi:hypothetical protein